MRVAASLFVIFTAIATLALIWRPRHEVQAHPPPEPLPAPAFVQDDLPEHREKPKVVDESKTQFRKSVPRDHAWLLMCIRAYETGGGVLGRANYLDDGPPHCGAYQFTCSDDPNKQTLWRAYFGDRRPHEVTPAEQDAAALAVLLHDGGRIKPTRWPTPFRRCA